MVALSCGSSEKPADPGQLAGAETAAGIVFAIEKAGELAEPYRCARWLSDEQAAPISIAAGKTNLEVSGRRARVRIDDRKPGAPIGVAFVADARGARAPTVERLRQLAGSFEDFEVSLVVLLGGMGKTEEELYETLGAISEGAFVVIAVPGDRESIPAHRGAIARLTERGVAIVDGSLVRIVSTDDIAIGTFPGVSAAQQLVADSDGCQHFPEDAESLAKRLAEHQGLKVWAGYMPPRQSGESGSDMTISGVHIGETLVSKAVDQAGAHLVVHGLVDESATGAARGELKVADGARLVLGTGSVDSLPVRRPGGPVLGGSVLVATVAPKRVKWRRIAFGLPQTAGTAKPPQ